MLMPTPLITALAPLVVDAIKGKAKDAGPVGEVVADMLAGTADHERRKASVRPAILRATGVTAIIIANAGVFAALAPVIPGLDVSQETSDAMCMNLLYLFGAVGGAYGVGAGKRTVEKMKGAA